MDAIEHAREILRDAESRLRELAAKLAQEGKYSDTIQVAKLAEEVRNLTSGRVEPAVEPLAVVVPHRHLGRTPRNAVTRRSTPKTKPETDYPRFERRGDELVKIGWSKSESAEYEHRAPKAAVDEVTRSLEVLGKGGKLVSTAELMPVIHQRGGAEVPPYQVYVSLAWLRDIGLIEQVGRQGYAIKSPERGFRAAVEQLWDKI